MRKLYKTFFNIEFPDFEDTFTAIKKCMKTRHQIIHGDLKDEGIDADQVHDYKNRIVKLISYLRDQLHRKYSNNLLFALYL